MSTTPHELRPRRHVAWWLLAGAALLLLPVARLVVRSFHAETASGRWTDLGMAAALLVVVVLLPALLARAILQARVLVDGDVVTRLRSGQVVATMRMGEVDQVAVGWQGMPGVMRRRPTVTLIGPTGGSARGIVVNGALLDDLSPLLRLVDAEVSRRPDVLGSDRATYDVVIAEAGLQQG